MGGEKARIIESINHFEGIALEEMDSVRLMNRIDTKYLLHINNLMSILEKASGRYRVLSINGNRVFRYNSLYYDTPGLKCYFDHHNGIRPRYKVRIREYEDTGTMFLEVKRKFGNERTRKSRIKTDRIEDKLSERSRSYIEKHSPLSAPDLIPSIWTLFRRITLVGKEMPERITIDIDLSFRLSQNNETLPFLSICEVKRDQFNGLTEFMKILKAERIYPSAGSKYCLGNILLRQPIKYNRFKSIVRTINKLENVYRPHPAAG